MKKLLLWLFGAALIGVGCAVLYLVTAFPRSRPAVTGTLAATPERLARGAYLAEHVLVCTECHADRDWAVFGAPPRAPLGAGRLQCLSADSDMAGMDASFPGKLCFPNVTPDRETGVGDWSDGELLRAVREGVDREGQALFPIMPYFIFRSLSEEDARSIVVWLRSLPAVRRAHRPRHVDFPVNLFIGLVPRPLTEPVPEPDRSDEVAYGQYLATIGRCAFCHSTRRGQNPEPLPGMRFAGGNEFRGPFGIRRSTNLTPDATGIGSLSRTDFIALFKRHTDPRSVPPDRNTVMPWASYAGMTAADLGAIYAYLRTMPPVVTQASRDPGRRTQASSGPGRSPAQSSSAR